MNNKHRWYDVIVAWASGETVQFRNEYSDWIEFAGDSSPNFNLQSLNSQSFEWRIKPKTITKRYRMALVYNYGVVSVDITNSSLDDPIEYNIQGFIRWVGDAVEVEIDV